MNTASIKRKKREMRHKRVRAKIKGTAQKPRLSVFRSNRHIYLQLIDDEKGRTIVSAGDIQPKASRPTSPLAKSKAGRGRKSKIKMTKTKLAFEAGKNLAELAQKKKIKNVVFDRGGYAYHGRVKAAAEGAREGGLEF